MDKHNNTFKKAISILLISVMALALIVSYYIINRHTMSYQPAPLLESDANPDNPYMGWYEIYGYSIDDYGVDTVDSITSQLEEDDSRLCLLEVNINAYKNTEIPVAAIDNLNLVLSIFRQHDRQLILRVLYDWDGNTAASEPDDIGRIYNHMDSLAAVINQNKDIIYISQGIFVGEIGEMHGSKYVSDSNMATLAKHWLALIDSDIYIAVRTLAQYDTILDACDSASTGSSAINTSRLCLFNDGMMGSASDLGSFTDRDYAISRQNDICLTVPNGGEAIIDNPYNDIGNAVKYMSTIHVSYLNKDYDEAVLNKWKNTSYNSVNGYDYISRHMGYRLYISQFDISDSARSNIYNLNCTISNSGFSSCYVPADINLSLIPVTQEKADTHDLGRSSVMDFIKSIFDTNNKSSNTEVINLQLDGDIRAVYPNGSSDFTYSIAASDIPAGEYDMYISLATSSGHDIALVNDGNDTGKTFVGRLIIK